MNRILIVDDEKSIQLLFADELTEEGYEVITTGDGSELIGMIEKWRPDLVVLDIKLGENDGLDLLQDIRNTYYDLPVVMCTAYPDFKYDLKSIAADYYVVKSSDLRELKTKIKMAFESGEKFQSSTMFNHLHQEAAPLQNTL
jgi:DNA-binding response OmpR family regulator